MLFAQARGLSDDYAVSKLYRDVTSTSETDRVTAEQFHLPAVHDVTAGHGDARLQQEDVVVLPRLNDRVQLVNLSATRAHITTLF